MSSQLADRHRTVVPRWRTFAKTNALRGIRSISQAADAEQPPDKDVQERLIAFHANPTTWHAADLLGEALLLQSDEAAREAAEFIIDHKSQAMPLAVEMAEKTLGIAAEEDGHDPSWRVQLHALRDFAETYPNNAIAWMDTALAYTVLGSKEHAARAVRTALALAKDNRFILRSAVRFYVHRNELDRAHELLLNSAATPHDPWLVSAEIAVANARKRTSRLLTVGRHLTENDNFRAYDRSELAIALATAEHEAGARQKRIRTLVRQSMLDPTENAVAQAEWLSVRNESLDGVNVKAMDVPCIFEARAQERYQSGDWEKAFENTLLWFEDQPFSSRPAIMAQYLANTVMDDQERAVEIGQRAVRPNPNDPYLLNNLAFSLANTGNAVQARKYIERARQQQIDDEGLQIAVTATEGLIAFRLGDAEAGRKLYAAAEKQATEEGLRREAQMATLYLTNEELRIGAVTRQLLDKAISIVKRSNDPMVHLVANRIMKTMLTAKA